MEKIVIVFFLHERSNGFKSEMMLSAMIFMFLTSHFFLSCHFFFIRTRKTFCRSIFITRSDSGEQKRVRDVSHFYFLWGSKLKLKFNENFFSLSFRWSFVVSKLSLWSHLENCCTQVIELMDRSSIRSFEKLLHSALYFLFIFFFTSSHFVYAKLNNNI